MREPAALKTIAHIRTDFPEKFGIPRQSGLVPELRGMIVFEPEYRNPDALRGLEGFDYIWLLWGFQGTERAGWSPTVRPPRLGGNRRVGVFATRSPFRPNPIGLSSVRLEKIVQEADGPALLVSGIDMRDGTPIYDIKPYLPCADSHADARGGFTEGSAVIAGMAADRHTEVDFPEHLLAQIAPEKRRALIAVLRQNPRPQYHRDPNRVYGMAFDRYNVQFTAEDHVVHVTEVSAR